MQLERHTKMKSHGKDCKKCETSRKLIFVEIKKIENK